MNDVLGHIPGVTSRAMFGGYGIYKNGVIFALIAYEKLYFKSDETVENTFKSAGGTQFEYSKGNHKFTKMRYWTIPQEDMDDPNKVSTWVEKSYLASKRNMS